MLIVYIASLILIALVVTGFLVVLDRRDARAQSERAGLLQRIQAPQAAIAAHHQAVTPVPVEAGSGMPMSDAEIAEAASGQPIATQEQQKERLIAWMEAVENGAVQIEDGVIQ
jgi:hypothetical protein